MPKFVLPMEKALAAHPRARTSPQAEAKSEVNVAEKVKRMLIDLYDVEAGEVRVRDLIPSDFSASTTGWQAAWGNDDWAVTVGATSKGNYKTVLDTTGFEDEVRVLGITRIAIVSADPKTSKVKVESGRKLKGFLGNLQQYWNEEVPTFTFYDNPMYFGKEDIKISHAFTETSGTVQVVFGGYAAEKESKSI